MQNSVYLSKDKVVKYEHIRNNNLSKSLIIIIIVSLATAPSFVLGKGNINLLLVVILGLSPIIIVLYKRLYYTDVLLLLFMGSIVVAPLLFHPESMRWSTVLYSYMFSLTFIAYDQLLHRKKFLVNDYIRVLKYLIYAYFTVLLIQQFCVLTGLPIFNVSNYDPATPWKLNSLAAEPSHSARILALLFYSYLIMKELVEKRKYSFYYDFKDDKWLWIAFFWTMLTMGSGTAFLFMAIVLLKFLRFKNILALIAILGFGSILISLMNIQGFERTFTVLEAVITLDPTIIIKADHSASTRIVPMILLATMVDISSINGWFGYGIDYVSTFMSDLLPGVPIGFTGGGLLLLWMEYGFISFFLFMVFSFLMIFRKNDYISIVFWFMLVFMYGVNNQMVWLAIILLYTNKYFYKIS